MREKRYLRKNNKSTLYFTVDFFSAIRNDQVHFVHKPYIQAYIYKGKVFPLEAWCGPEGG